MSKEEEIQEMAKIKCSILKMFPCSDSSYNPCKDCEDYEGEQCRNRFRLRESEALYAAGYRKESDLAKEILQKLYAQTFEFKYPYEESIEQREVIDREDLEIMAEKYGVKIDKE